jgi:hypothetical protein
MSTDEWSEIEQIKQLKYRYVRSLDLKLWDDFAACLAADCRWSSRGGTMTHDNRAAFVSWVIEGVGAPSRLSSHTVGHPQITLTSPTSATGTWKLESTIILVDQDLTTHGSGFYYDEYVKRAGTWIKQATGHELIFEETQPRESLGTRLTANHWATDQQS